MTSSDTPRSRLLAALVSGAIAIVLNTFALKAADLIPWRQRVAACYG